MATICYNQVMKEDVVKLRHERSLKDYPGLALEDDEYVELEINRSKAGLVLIWGIVILLSLIMAVSIAVLTLSGDFLGLNDTAHSYLLMLLIILFVIFIVAGLVLSYVYKGNRMYVTNHRIIRYTTDALFAHSKNVINLVSVEDVSFRQNSIILKSPADFEPRAVARRRFSSRLLLTFVTRSMPALPSKHDRQ